MSALPRLVVAAPASGHGKTTVATGLMAALRRAGHVVSGHKVGPDYIDPGYHALATGRPGRNLDPHLAGEERLAPLLLHGAAHADVSIIEGVMGLHDGQIGGDGFASTAHVARATHTPVVLVVDVSHASRSIGAMVHGIVAYDPDVRVVGVVLNKAGSQRHADEVIRSLEPTGLPVLGVLHRDEGVIAPSRHLGLVPVAERDDAARSLDRLANQIADAIDLDHLLALAATAPDLDDEPWDPDVEVRPTSDTRPVVAVAGGRAFTFRYAETTELLEAAGCEVVAFDPLEDDSLPPGTAGIYLGGGFPEVHAAGLAANTSLIASLRGAVMAGVPTVAECAGLLYLCRAVDGVPMVGALPADALMTGRLTLAYRRGVAGADTLLSRAGEIVTGHEFHRTTVSPAAADPAWVVDGQAVGYSADPARLGTTTVHASYLHTHWAGHPHLAQRFADAVHLAHAAGRVLAEPDEMVASAARERPIRQAQRESEPTGLRFHGDREVGDGLVDFAVNVFDGPRPEWLDEALRTSLDDVERYPNATEAEHALARRHGRRPAEVLATAGAAEAFTLIARMRPWQRPVVVHPQFTEPDVALASAGHEVTHVHADPGTGFALDPTAVPDDADLVIVGNPTNPTSTLHPARALANLARPGRLVVVDEAFMDAVPGERETLADAPRAGVAVLRSLTKHWSIPGVRAGYLLAEAGVIDELRAHQTPWSVSATAAAAMIACATEQARGESARRAQQITQRRAVLTDGLTELAIPWVQAPAGPFVLARLGAGRRDRLRDAGYALRRADTFPGLDDSWARIAVRAPETTRKLLAALRLEGT